MNINQFHDGETIRQQRNLTAPQKRVNAYTKEGVVVNNFIKEFLISLLAKGGILALPFST